MPLRKVGQANGNTAEAPSNENLAAQIAKAVGQASITATQSVLAAENPVPAAKARASKASANAPLTKDEYWTRKEERDIRTGECIRLSGVLQALLGSVNYGQFATSADKDAYLAQVKADAKMLAKFVTEEA